MKWVLGAGILAAALCSVATAGDDFHSAAPWLENFHHAAVPEGPVAPTRITPADQLNTLQQETMWLVRQARESEDFYATTYAIAEARANTMLAASLPAPVSAGSPVYLFELNDETVRPAVAWWVEGNTLHYVTPGGKQAETPLDAVDRALTERLNAERNVRLQLPPPRR
jgi:hypothetical protein